LVHLLCCKKITFLGCFFITYLIVRMNQYFIAEVSFALLNLVKDIQLFLASGSTKH
jgi:hypothetical protein